MKTLLLISIALVSINTYASELGEDQKSPCPYANQTMKRDAKPQIEEVATSSEESSTEGKAVSK